MCTFTDTKIRSKKKKKKISVTSLVVPRLKIGLEMQETQV